MRPNPKEQANHYYKTAFDRWALELSHDKNHLIAKSIALYLVGELKTYEHLETGDESWWEQVEQEIEKIK